MDNNEWRDFARCKDLDTSKFFPVSINRSSRKNIDEVIGYCNECPVGGHCLFEALSFNSLGIWAFTSHFQRESYLEFRDNSSPLTLEECQNYFEYIKANKIYPYTRSYKKAIKSMADSNE